MPAGVMRSATPQLRVVARNDASVPLRRPARRRTRNVTPALAALACPAVMAVALTVAALVWLCAVAATLLLGRRMPRVLTLRRSLSRPAPLHHATR